MKRKILERVRGFNPARNYPVGDEIAGSFIDDSTNEDDFRVYWNDLQVKGMRNDDPVNMGYYPFTIFNHKSIIDSAGTGKEIPFWSKSTLGYPFGNRANQMTGNMNVGVTAVNAAGESEQTDLGTVAKYNRADFYIYIGSNDLFGSGVSSDLHQFKGVNASSTSKTHDRGRDLSNTLHNALLMNNLKPGSFIKGDWRKAEPLLDEDVSAEISFLDYFTGMNNGNGRDVVVWKLGINNAMASSAFGPSGEGRNLIEQYLKSDFEALYDRFCQPRIAGCIMNMRLLDEDVDGAYQNLIDYIRTYLELPELPIILTDENENRIDTSSICFQLDPNNASPELKDYYEYRGMGGYYGFAEPDCITSPNFWKWNGEYPTARGNSTHKGWSYKWRKLYNLDLSEPTTNTYIKYTRAARLWNYGHLDSSSEHIDTGVFYHEHGENNYNISEYDKIFGYPSDLMLSLRQSGANGFINYEDPTRQNQNFYSNVAYVSSAALKDDNSGIDYLHRTRSYYEFPTTYGSSEIVESHVYQDQYRITKYGSDYILNTYQGVLPFLDKFDVPSSDNKDPDLEIHSYYNKYKHLMLPYVSGTRNDAMKRGIRTLDNIPSKFFNLINRNKKVRYVSRDLLPLDGDSLTTAGQVELGRQYAEALQNVHQVASIDGIEFTLRLDATHGVTDFIGTSYLSHHLAGPFENSAPSGVLNDPKHVVFEDSTGGLKIPVDTNQSWWLEDVPRANIGGADYNFSIHGNINGRPAWKLFDISFHCLARNVFRNDKHKYVFFVIKPHSDVQGKVFMETGNGSRTLCHFPWDNRAIFDFNSRNLGDDRVTIPDFFVESKPYVVTCAFDATKNFALMRANGVEMRRPVGSNDTSAQGNSFFIGGAPVNGAYRWSIDADIGEFMTCDTSIGMDGIMAIENYLSNKWKITT